MDCLAVETCGVHCVLKPATGNQRLLSSSHRAVHTTATFACTVLKRFPSRHQCLVWTSFRTYSIYTVKATEDPPKKTKSYDKLDGLCSRSLCERGHELSHSQPDDLVFVFVVFDGQRQPLHVEIDLHVFKLKRSNNHISDPEVCILMLVILFKWMESQTEVYYKLTVRRQEGKWLTFFGRLGLAAASLYPMAV